jgi:hypothetical protein
VRGVCSFSTFVMASGEELNDDRAYFSVVPVKPPVGLYPPLSSAVAVSDSGSKRDRPHPAIAATAIDLLRHVMYPERSKEAERDGRRSRLLATAAIA